MLDKLLNHIKQQNDGLPRDEISSIEKYFTPINVAKNDYFLKQGDVCKTAAFITQGCFRNYIITSEGKEVNTLFCFENWWIGELSSYATGCPSKFNCQALEGSTFLEIKSTEYSKLLLESMSFAKYTRELMSNNAVSGAIRSSTLSESAEVRYQKLLEKFPDIEQRISQKHIASYLQITPEFFNRLKNK